MSIFVISGGAGFLGASLAQRLGRAGHEVRVLDDLSAPASARRAEELAALPSVFVARGDVRDVAQCRQLCADADFVVHFASPPAAETDAARCMETVVGGALVLMDAARDAGTVRRFVLASSSAVYGEQMVSARHEASLPEPATPQACALLSAEHFCRAAFRQHGLPTVCLRFFDVYGPGMDIESAGTPLAALVRAAATSRPAAVPSDHTQASDWIFVEDAVEAALRAISAQRGVGGKVFNVGTGRALSVGTTREMLQRLSGRPVPIQPAPAAGGTRAGRADTAAAAGLLQFTAAVGPEDGLAQTLHWAEKQFVRVKEFCSA